ncbi:MAG TPA: MBL fold metallo-hydrolase [Limnochordia bacterium]
MLEDEFGDVVQKARAGLGLTVAELAERSGLTTNSIEAFEAYRERPDRAAVERLAASLDLDAGSLWALAAGEYLPKPVSPELGDGLEVETFTFSGPASHGYVVRGPGASLIIDPGGTASRLLEAALAGGRQVVAILITHAHGDHVGALEPVARAAGCPVYVHPAERLGAALPEERIRVLTAETPFTAGGIRIEPLFCPGHTQGGVAFAIGSGVFVGDTLFAGSLGRAASPSLYGSLIGAAVRLVEREPATKLFPGHGPATTAGEERRANPFLAHRVGPGGKA